MGQRGGGGRGNVHGVIGEGHDVSVERAGRLVVHPGWVDGLVHGWRPVEVGLDAAGVLRPRAAGWRQSPAIQAA